MKVLGKVGDQALVGISIPRLRQATTGCSALAPTTTSPTNPFNVPSFHSVEMVGFEAYAGRVGRDGCADDPTRPQFPQITSIGRDHACVAIRSRNNAAKLF